MKCITNCEPPNAPKLPFDQTLETFNVNNPTSANFEGSGFLPVDFKLKFPTFNLVAE